MKLHWSPRSPFVRKVMIRSFRKKVQPGDIIVAGKNFGHHSHPHACVAMIQSGIRACLCESTDSAFIRKALNVGLPVIPCPGVAEIFESGDRLSTDLVTGLVENARAAQTRSFRPFCAEMIEVWECGGLAPALRKRIARSQTNQEAMPS